MSYLDSLKDELVEIYQRRNLLVHNKGIVNSTYLSKVNEKYRKGIKINDSLSVDKVYLDNAICKLQKAFILIASELWKNVDKSDKKRGKLLSKIVHENLLKHRWELCEGLTCFIYKDLNLDPEDRTAAQLNYWYCMKETGQFDTVKSELEKTDYSDRKEIYQIALFALKDDKKSFFKTIPIAFTSGPQNIKFIEEHPLFKDLRDSKEYQLIREESQHYKEYSNDTTNTSTVTITLGKINGTSLLES